MYSVVRVNTDMSSFVCVYVRMHVCVVRVHANVSSYVFIFLYVCKCIYTKIGHLTWWVGAEIAGLNNPGQDIGIFPRISSKNYKFKSNKKETRDSLEIPRSGPQNSASSNRRQIHPKIGHFTWWMGVGIWDPTNPGQDIGISSRIASTTTKSEVAQNRPETARKCSDLGPKMRPPQIGAKYTPKSAILHGEWGSEYGIRQILVRT